MKHVQKRRKNIEREKKDLCKFFNEIGIEYEQKGDLIQINGKLTYFLQGGEFDPLELSITTKNNIHVDFENYDNTLIVYAFDSAYYDEHLVFLHVKLEYRNEVLYIRF